MNTVYGTECSVQIVHDKMKAFLVVGSVGWLHLEAVYELDWLCKQFILPVCCQTLLAPVTPRRMRVNLHCPLSQRGVYQTASRPCTQFSACRFRCPKVFLEYTSIALPDIHSVKKV